jgi:hypothetical protein
LLALLSHISAGGAEFEEITVEEADAFVIEGEQLQELPLPRSYTQRLRMAPMPSIQDSRV